MVGGLFKVLKEGKDQENITSEFNKLNGKCKLKLSDDDSFSFETIKLGLKCDLKAG